MFLKQLGEFPVVRRILRSLDTGRKKAFVVGPGDDAFAAYMPPGDLLVATKDLLLEDIHFKRSWATPRQIGYKSIAVNLSDLASMGACKPLFGLIGLGLPGDIHVDFVDKLYQGMLEISRKYGLLLAGGDTVSSKKQIVISISLIGGAKERYLLTRAGAKPGDVICVTGTFGDSGGGLVLLQKGVKRGSKPVDYLIKKHLLPEPRLAQAEALAKSGVVTSMIDSSDGLAASLKFICESSGVGARVDVDSIPLSGPLRKLSSRYGLDPVGLALQGGEDYELVFTVPEKHLQKVLRAARGITPVGRIVPGREARYYYHDGIRKVKGAGYEHFA